MSTLSGTGIQFFENNALLTTKQCTFLLKCKMSWLPIDAEKGWCLCFGVLHMPSRQYKEFFKGGKIKSSELKSFEWPSGGKKLKEPKRLTPFENI